MHISQPDVPICYHSRSRDANREVVAGEWIQGWELLVEVREKQVPMGLVSAPVDGLIPAKLPFLKAIAILQE
ncbi:MAG: hypothetical protein Q8Q13_00205 [bacterium]|nr:hypothetical protein [bacterium]